MSRSLRLTTREAQLRAVLIGDLQALRLRLQQFHRLIRRSSPGQAIGDQRAQLRRLSRDGARAIQSQLDRAEARVTRASSQLQALNPQAVLLRGYAMVTDPSSGRVVTDAQQVQVDAPVDVALARGGLACRVTGRRRK